MLTIELEDLENLLPEEFTERSRNERLKIIKDLLSNEKLIQQTSEKSFMGAFPVQKSVDCVANSLSNALLYIWNETPSILNMDFDGGEYSMNTSEGEDEHKKFVKKFQEQSDSPKGYEGTDLRTIEDIQNFLQNSPDTPLCKSFQVFNEEQAIKKLSQGGGCATLIQAINGHATMVYLRKSDDALELVEIDSLKGHEKVLSSEEFVDKLYPTQNQYDPGIYWIGIEEPETLFEFLIKEKVKVKDIIDID